VRQDYWGQHALQDYASIIDEDQLDVHELAAVVDFDEPELVTVGDIDTMDAFLGGLPLEAVMYESGGVRRDPTPEMGTYAQNASTKSCFASTWTYCGRTTKSSGRPSPVSKKRIMR